MRAFVVSAKKPMKLLLKLFSNVVFVSFCVRIEEKLPPIRVPILVTQITKFMYTPAVNAIVRSGRRRPLVAT